MDLEEALYRWHKRVSNREHLIEIATDAINEAIEDLVNSGVSPYYIKRKLIDALKRISEEWDES